MKTVFDKNKTDLNELYEIYKQCRSGDTNSLNNIFKMSGSTKPVKRRDMDNVLDAELVQEKIKLREEAERLKVVFTFDCLNKMLSKMKTAYDSSAVNTGFEDGEKIVDGRYKKYYSGNYDISSIEEIMQEIIIKLFTGKLPESSIQIVDGKTLLQNIKYWMTKEVNEANKDIGMEVPEYSVSELDGEEYSRFDECQYNKWEYSDRDSSRMPIYEDALGWLKAENDLKVLFNSDSYDIRSIIDTIRDRSETFENLDYIKCGMKLVGQEKLRNLIACHTGRSIAQNNISKDMQYIEQKFIDHLFYGLNCYIGKAPKNSNDIFSKESERFLYRMDKERYIRLNNSAVEKSKIEELKNQYKMIEKYVEWESDFKEDFFVLKFYNKPSVKKPIKYTINRTDLFIYSGRNEFYICNDKSKECICVSKDKRIVTKSNNKHEILRYPIKKGAFS